MNRQYSQYDGKRRKTTTRSNNQPTTMFTTITTIIDNQRVDATTTDQIQFIGGIIRWWNWC
jgi:hypothetical protein